MFCNNCGANLEEGTKFCDKCGAKTDGTGAVNNRVNSGKGLLYATIVIAFINAILPFLKWVKMPIVNSFYSQFGMGNNVTSHSLFGCIFAGDMGDSGVTYVVILILALVSLISVIFNAMYCVKAFLGRPKASKWGTMGSISLLIMSLLFFIIVGLISAILKIISLSSTVYLAIILSIINIVLLKKIKNA